MGAKTKFVTGTAAGYAALVLGSTAMIHGYANRHIEPVAARNMDVYMNAPIFAEARAGKRMNLWAGQQRRISFRLLANNVITDFAVVNAFNGQGKAAAAQLERHNIALLPELDGKAKPGLTVDGAEGCINLAPTAEPLTSAQHASQLLAAFAKNGSKPGTYSFVGEDADISILHVPLPAGKTASHLCREVRPVLHQHQHS